MFFACCCAPAGVPFCNCASTDIAGGTVYATVSGLILGSAAANGSWTLVWDATHSFYLATTPWSAGIWWALRCKIEGGNPYPDLNYWNGSAFLQPNVFQFEDPFFSSNTCSPYYMTDLFHAPPNAGAVAVVTS